MPAKNTARTERAEPGGELAAVHLGLGRGFGGTARQLHLLPEHFPRSDRRGTVTHNAAVRSDGTLLTWGDDSQGQLGNGTCCTTTNPDPVPVPSLASVSQVAIGLDFMLALGSPPPPPVVVAVPDLSGDSQATASHNLQAVGLVLGSVGTVTDNSCNNIGTVLSQSPAAGTHVNQGSAVSITVGKRPTHPCP